MRPDHTASAHIPRRGEAANAALFPGAETALNPPTIQVRANDFEEGYRKSLRLMSLANVAARETAIRATLAVAPDAAAWQTRIGESGEQRFLGWRRRPRRRRRPPARHVHFGAR